MAINRPDPKALPPSAAEASRVGPPRAEPAPVERVIGDDKSTATLIGIIRDSSKITNARLDSIVKELSGFRRDAALFTKSLEPMVKYYQKKVQKYALLEEQYFTSAVKAYAKMAGVSDKFPPGNPIYRQGGAGPTDFKGSKDPKASEVPEAGQKDEGPLEAFGRRMDNAYHAVLESVKTANSYVQSPIKLIDVAFAKVVSLPLALIQSTKAHFDAKAAESEQKEAEQEEDKTTDEQMAADFWDKMLASPEPGEEEPEEQEEEEPAPVVEPESQPDPVAPAVREAILEAEEVKDDNLVPGVSPTDLMVLGDTSPMAMAIKQILLAIQQPDEFLPATLKEASSYETGLTTPYKQPEFSPHPLQITGAVYPDSTEPEPPGGGHFGPGGIFSGKEDAEDARFTKDVQDDTMDSWETMLAPVLAFYDTPDQSAVGAFLRGLLAPSVVGDPDDELAKAIKKLAGLANIIIIALIPILLLIAAGVVLVAAAVAAAVLLVGVGIFAVLVAIAAAVLVVAAILAGLGIIIGFFLFRVLMAVADGVEALVEAFIDFIKDPGAFLAKLATGLATAVKALLSAIIDSLAEAFEKIPILKTLSDFFNELKPIIIKMGTDIGNVFSKITELVAKIVESLIPPIETMAGIVTAILSVLGAALLSTVVKILASVSAIDTFIRSGGISFDKDERKAAMDAAASAYDATAMSYVSLIKDSAGLFKNSPEVQQLVVSMGDVVEKSVARQGAAKPGDVSSGKAAAAGPTYNTNTVVQSVPGFYGIPIFGGGF